MSAAPTGKDTDARASAPQDVPTGDGRAETVPEWLREHYAHVDANDFTWIGKRFAEDVEVRFGNRPSAIGRAAVGATLADVHAPFKHSRHAFTNVWEQGETTLAEFDVTYEMNDGAQVRIETFTVLERRDGLIDSMRVYIDEGPLRER